MLFQKLWEWEGKGKEKEKKRGEKEKKEKEEKEKRGSAIRIIDKSRGKEAGVSL